MLHIEVTDPGLAQKLLSGLVPASEINYNKPTQPGLPQKWQGVALSTAMHVGLAISLYGLSPAIPEFPPEILPFQAYLVEPTPPVQTPSPPPPLTEEPPQADQTPTLPDTPDIALPAPTLKPTPKPTPRPTPKATTAPKIIAPPVVSPAPSEAPTAAPMDLEQVAAHSEATRIPNPPVSPAPPPAPAPTKPAVDARYAGSNPQPKYPSIARRLGLEGTVTLQITVGREGKALQVEVVDSSGHDMLDNAAVSAIKNWRFVPGTRNGEPIVQTLQTKWTYKLQN